MRMSEGERCVHCGAPTTTINYALGLKLVHYTPEAGWPSESRGTAWEFCRLLRAEVLPARAGQHTSDGVA